MTGKDLMKICLQNLFRRKMRTFLTILGVVVGCCSIVIMISLGIGMKQSQEQMLSQMGDLSLITVSAPHGGKQGVKLDNKMLDKIKGLDNIEALSPKSTLGELTIKIFAGSDRRFFAESPTIIGMDTSALSKLGYEFVDDKGGKAKTNGALIGEFFEYSFMDSLRPEGRNMVDRYDNEMENGGEENQSKKKAFFDGLQAPLTLEIEVSEGKKVSVPLTLQRRMKENYGKGFETSDGIILPLKELESIKKTLGIQSSKKQPYEMVMVKVSSIEKVAELEKEIKSLGLQTYSMESLRKPLEKEARQKQMMLGGLGGISLFVAAIGITNTMVMSITERRKEIGIMKALGCYVKDIRKLFLAEAAAIGLFGGLLGCIISLAISFFMNLAASQGGMASLGENFAGGSSSMSVIPLWLLLFAVMFSVGIGLGLGYYPAHKAVKISALEAIKNE